MRKWLQATTVVPIVAALALLALVLSFGMPITCGDPGSDAELESELLGIDHVAAPDSGAPLAPPGDEITEAELDKLPLCEPSKLHYHPMPIKHKPVVAAPLIAQVVCFGAFAPNGCLCPLQDVTNIHRPPLPIGTHPHNVTAKVGDEEKPCHPDHCTSDKPMTFKTKVCEVVNKGCEIAEETVVYSVDCGVATMGECPGMVKHTASNATACTPCRYESKRVGVNPDGRSPTEKRKSLQCESTVSEFEVEVNCSLLHPGIDGWKLLTTACLSQQQQPCFGECSWRHLDATNNCTAQIKQAMCAPPGAGPLPPQPPQPM